MKNIPFARLSLTAFTAAALFLTGCEKRDSIGDKIEKAGEKAGDAVDDAGNKTGDALKDAGDSVKDASR